ncbi:Nif3-like dinuclear metal center hexameric protein [Alkalitalea saponilacus]|uniref:GTP cyclohydrolase 1 type 2 homolog n=1 Tax=Alkalitalea saponilacus TaxID=889453 RepID=A0A1T5BMJ9_9BACT|nr:Nif3-like dinuclear metal center hexameric protein [Alkalitalea saponilacus]ASB49651.1 Nif3-like dinuclear metal center hexameric protein [Alkalitalea saponilacus]SKB48454.1 dinuclear metal center protein, YbgI/SA1388 family [Alkalitalea saponilacus]
MTIKEIISHLEDFAPQSLQEGFDNSGMQTGDVNQNATGVLITLDVTPEVVDESIKTNCNLIISHHPVTISGVKSLTGKNLSEQVFIKAIKNNIAIYTAHTNIDNVKNGVSGILANKLGLINHKILSLKQNALVKLVVFVPKEAAGEVRNAIFEAGAGQIGNYDSCSFNIAGEGTFRGDESTNPYVGEKGELHTEPEIRVETILPATLQSRVLNALIKAHPYEEPAFDFYPLNNSWPEAGLGIVGEYHQPLSKTEFLTKLKEVTNASCIRYTECIHEKIQKVAVCGGSGSSFLRNAIASGAQAFVTGDFKYHQFFDAENRIMIADVGHYESEQFTKELFFEILTKKIPNFAVRLSEVNSNPIKYF